MDTNLINCIAIRGECNYCLYGVSFGIVFDPNAINTISGQVSSEIESTREYHRYNMLDGNELKITHDVYDANTVSAISVMQW